MGQNLPVQKSKEQIMKKLLLCLALLINTQFVQAQSGPEYARYDIATRTWEFRFQPQDTEGDVDWVTYKYEERNHIKPKMHSTLSQSNNNYIYHYRVSNERSAPQVINFFFANAPFTPLPLKKPTPSAALLNSNQNAMKEWMFDLKARRNLEKTTQNTSMSKPTGWRNKMSFGEKSTGFGWFPEIEPYGPGVPPGSNAKGFELRRPELPGAVFAYMKGRVEEPALPGGYKTGGPVEAAIQKILATDQVFVATLAPAIVLPVPYSAAEHAKRLKSHVQTWVGDEDHLPLISPDMLDRVNRDLDSLIQAAEYNNKQGILAAFTAILTDVFKHHKGMTHTHFTEDGDEHESESMPPRVVNPTATFPISQGIHRVAARALGINLMYLLTQVEKNRSEKNER